MFNNPIFLSEEAVAEQLTEAYNLAEPCKAEYVSCQKDLDQLSDSLRALKEKIEQLTYQRNRLRSKAVAAEETLQKARKANECVTALRNARKFIEENLSTNTLVVASSDKDGYAVAVGIITKIPGGYGYLSRTTDKKEGIVKLVDSDTYQRWDGDVDPPAGHAYGDKWYVVKNT
jgi:outer membrane murein-binding lipoprotein Lpp